MYMGTTKLKENGNYEKANQNCLKNERGKFILIRGDIFEGEFKGKNKNGFEKYYEVGNSFYRMWNCGKMYGFGILLYANGSKYE